MFGPELTQINELTNTARSAVLKDCAGRGFFFIVFCGVSREILKT